MIDKAARLTRDRASAELFQGKVHFAPVRHHSPACAWMVRAMIRSVKPNAVLIEAPHFLEAHIPHILAEDTEFPIAIVALLPGENDRRETIYFPISSHAPELVAIQEAQAIGATICFIDSNVREDEDLAVSLPALQDETPFNSSDFIRKACQATGMRDGNELWDHLFEHRLGHCDWQDFFADVYAYCLGMRNSTPTAQMEADGTLAREQVMRHFLKAHQDQSVVIVTGGFHTPALVSGGPTAKPKLPSRSVEHYLIAYSEDALDAHSGYAAGLQFPKWYRAAWEAAQISSFDQSDLAKAHLAGFVHQMAQDGMTIAVPQQVELLTQAKGLARFRGRDSVLLHDFFDGVRTALVKSQAGPGDPYLAKATDYLKGTKLGRAPKAAGLPPVVLDAQTQALKHRVDLDTTERKLRKLDIRRKPENKAASQYFQQLTLLETGAATLLAGPDFLTGHRIDLLFEEWEVGWSPFVEGKLIDAAHLGATVRQAALGVLEKQAEDLQKSSNANAVSPWLNLLMLALRAGLSEGADYIYTNLNRVLTETSELANLAETLERLRSVTVPSDPLHDSNGLDIWSIAQRAYDRFVFLIPSLEHVPDDALDAAVRALRVVFGVLQLEQEDRFIKDRFFDALLDLSLNPDADPLAGGAALALCAAQDSAYIDDLETALQGSLAGVGLNSENRGYVFQAILMTAPHLLWQNQQILSAAHTAIMGLDDEQFLDLLPRMRLALTDLNPHEVDRLAEELAHLFDLNEGILLAQSRFDEADLMAGLAVNQKLADLLRYDGLEVPNG